MQAQFDTSFPNNWQQQRVIIPLARHFLHRWFRSRTHGLENVPEDQACIFVAKHPRSMLYLETMLLGVHTFCEPNSKRRPFRVLEKPNTSLHKMPVIGWMRRNVGALAATEDQAAAALESGQSLLIFPGGPRELYGRADVLRWADHRGFARLAARAQVPVVPVAMVGADQQHAMRVPLGRRSSLWLPLFPMPVRIDYWFGPAVPPPPVHSDGPAIRAYANDVRSATDQLLRSGLAQRQEH